jgi:hypothetical protein
MENAVHHPGDRVSRVPRLLLSTRVAVDPTRRPSLSSSSPDFSTSTAPTEPHPWADPKRRPYLPLPELSRLLASRSSPPCALPRARQPRPCASPRWCGRRARPARRTRLMLPSPPPRSCDPSPGSPGPARSSKRSSPHEV